MDPASVSIDNTTMMESMEYEQPSFSTMDGDELGGVEQHPEEEEEEEEQQPHDDATENLESSFNESKFDKEVDAIINNTGQQLEVILQDIKGATKRLFDEFQTYVETATSVTNDYTRCQESQSKEAQRLAEVSPDVDGATNRFLQQQLAMLSGQTN